MVQALPERPLDSPLNARQERFCRAYVANRGKGAEAAREAGYSERTAREMAYENLTKPHVLARVRELQEEVLRSKGDLLTRAMLALEAGLADPDNYVGAARVILDHSLKARALDLRERELHLKQGLEGSDAARVVYVEQAPAVDEEDWNRRVAEELANVRGSGASH